MKKFFMRLLLLTLWNRHENFMGCYISQAAEIEATSEWTLLKEGDTIPAGLQIRMDLSTGEKWVKLIDDENDNHGAAKEEVISIVGEEGTFSAEMKPDGSVALIRNTNDNSLQKQEEEIDSTGKKGAPEYDFMMMHRTLSKLGPEEVNQMGLPALPPKEASRDEIEQFEKQMETIWTTRQKALAELELADLPKILKKHIYSIQSYIQDGVISNSGLLEKDELEDGEDADIQFVLEDLEYQLNDLDNARDFHTLDGWPLLVSLLSDAAHTQALKHIHYSHSNQTDIEFPALTELQLGYKHEVQALAAWAIGSAVKNIPEFFPWVLEDVSKLGYVFLPKSTMEESSHQSITSLDLLLFQFQKLFLAKDTKETKFAMKLQQKIVYALGSLLRLNESAQKYFLTINGPKILGSILEQIISKSTLSKKEISLASKILNLGSDVVTEVGENPEKEHSTMISLAFSNPSWCGSVTSLLGIASKEENMALEESILEVANSMSFICRDLWDSRIQDLVRNIIEKFKERDMDEEWKKEILNLGNRVLRNMVKIA